jgi:hypothetical protein
MMNPKSRLYRLICALLFCSLIPQFALAEDKKASQILLELEQDMHNFFPNVLNKSYDQVLQTEMLRRSGDLHNAVVKTIAGLVRSRKQLIQISTALKEYAGPWSEKRYASLSWTRYVTKKILNDTQMIGQSIDMLTKYWPERCDKKHFKDFLMFYNPSTLFPRDTFNPEIPVQKVPFSVSVNVSTSEGGGTTTTATFGEPKDKTQKYIQTGCTVGGAVVGYLIGGQVGAYIGALIGSIVGSLVNYFINAYAAHNEFKKMQATKDRIRDFMHGEIDGLSARREKLFLDVCNNYFDKDQQETISGTLTALKKAHAELQKSAQQMNIYLEAEYTAFPEKLATYLKEVEVGYLDELSSRMTESQNELLTDLTQVDRSTVLYQLKQVNPVLRSEAQANFVIGRLEARDELWRKQVVGDSLFQRTHEGLAIDEDRLGPWKEFRDHISGVMKGAL